MFCPNAVWAIIFRKPKTFIPMDVRRHVLKLRGYAITIDELTSYVNTKFLRRMTKHYSKLKEPNALRGPQFSQHAFEKAEDTWKSHQQITNPKRNSTFQSHSTHSKRPKTNILTMPVSEANPKRPDENEGLNEKEGSDNEAQDFSSGSDA
jgi:hypothetical protein